MANFFDFFNDDDSDGQYALYAAALIGGSFAGPVGVMAASTAIGLNEGRKAKNAQEKEQAALEKAQQTARSNEIQTELGMAQQRTNIALTSADTRPKGQQQASFGAQSILGGGLPSLKSGDNVNNNAGSAGTF